jgi:acyl-CoA synthetase (AMP-forming)/AMP-acid ligase II
MQSHNNVAAVIDNMQSEFDFKKSDCNLAVAPLTHGGSHYIIPILAVGGCHLLLTEPNIDDIVNAFKYHQASVSFMPPTLIYKLIEYPNICADDFPKLRHLTYSAAPMPPERIVQVISTIGPKLSTVYGQTEAPMTITAMSSHDMTVAHLQASVGKACKYSEVTTFNTQGEPLPIGETGEIAVKGDIVMLGYFNQPDKTQSIFNNGWLLTGDLGFIDKNQYVFIQGRSKEVMITGGFNVYPGEVENAAIEINDVNECVAFSMEDKYWGERIEIVVKLNKGSAISSEYIRQKLKPILGAVKTPKAVHIVDNIPRNPVGKITKRDIKSLIYPE